MKKILLLLFACMFMSIGVQAQNVTDVSLNHDTITLAVGSDTILYATLTPDDAANTEVIWGTIDAATASIITTSATVEENLRCTVKGEDVGVTKVFVKHIDSGCTDTCVINVIRLAENVQLNENAMTITLGRDSILKAFISPHGVTNDSIIWISRNSSIVNIISTPNNRYDTICNITALKLGTVFIVGETVDGGFKDSCAVTVVAGQIESFSLTSDSIDLIVGSDTTITAQIRPLEGTIHTINWSTDDIYDRVISRSAGYDTTITITAKGSGQAKVIATAYDGKKDTCVITVRAQATGISLNKDSMELNINADTIALFATFTPSFVINDSIRWTSNDPNTVFITTPENLKNGTACQINALRAGTAKIFAETFDGGFKDSCVVTVVIPTDSVVLRVEKNPLNLKADTTTRIFARFYPDLATTKKLTWFNLNESLVKIDSVVFDTICYIKALKSGIDTIYAKTPDGIISDSCFIVIDAREADSVKITKSQTIINDKDTIRLNVKESFEVLTTVYPFNVTNDSVTLVSTNPEIASIDSTSTSVFIRALKEGEAIVYATPADGNNGKKDSVIVKVMNVGVTSLSLDADTIRMYEQYTGTLIAKILPANVSNDSVVWSTNDNSVIRIESSTGNDTICTFTALKADTAFIYAISKENGAIKDSCVVIVNERYVFLESNTTTIDGKIEVSIVIPPGILFTNASFELQLPKGFGLTKAGSGYKSSLTNEAKFFADLSIRYINDSTYIFKIDPKITTSIMLRAAGTLTKIMDIYYTIYDNTLEGKADIYNAIFKDATVVLSNATVVKEDHVVKIKVFKDQTGNDIFDNPNESLAYFVDDLLYVKSDKVETIYVYTLNGSLLYSNNKAEGLAVFDIKTSEKVLIVKGSSGWAAKVANK